MAGKFNLSELLSGTSLNAAENENTAAGAEQSAPRRQSLKIVSLNIHDLVPSDANFYAVDKIDELKMSIEMFGVQQNLTVKPLPNGKYEIIAGHRRHKACMVLYAEGKTEYEYVPCGIQSERDEIKERILLIIRKWKSVDKWQDELGKKKRGGQKGNKNAAGHGAPKGNKNAETHGAYSRVHLENLTPDEREYIEALTLDAETNMLRELQLLFAKERDLTRKINEHENADADTLFVDRVVEMYTPSPKKEKGEQEDGAGAAGERLKTAMRTVIKASPFERSMKLEAELNKTHGRILKLIDSMRTHELDVKRLDLEERKHSLAKQRLTGEYNIDPDTGEIIDAEEMDDVFDE